MIYLVLLVITCGSLALIWSCRADPPPDLPVEDRPEFAALFGVSPAWVEIGDPSRVIGDGRVLYVDTLDGCRGWSRRYNDALAGRRP